MAFHPRFIVGGILLITSLHYGFTYLSMSMANEVKKTPVVGVALQDGDFPMIARRK